MWKKILLGIVVFIAVVVGVVFYMTSDMTKAADRFFDEIKAKQYDGAYAMLSKEFRRDVSKKNLITFLHKTGLDGYKSSSWGNRSFEGKKGKVEGVIDTESGRSIPLLIQFVKGENGWKIYSISKPKSGTKREPEQKKPEVSEAAMQKPSEKTVEPKTEEAIVKAVEERPRKQDVPKVPNDADVIKLEKSTTHIFASAIKEKNMKSMYENISKIWRQQTSVEELNKTFAPFIDANLDLTILDIVNPIIDFKPGIDSNGVMLIKGHYALDDAFVYFDYEYIMENGVWKLIGLNVNIKPPK